MEEIKKIIEYCELCSFETLKMHCKIICKNCGFMSDCSDP